MTPIVGEIVHLLHGGTCFAAIITEVSESGVGLHVFPTPAGTSPSDGYEPFNPLDSARPTSGWHWPEEHEPLPGDSRYG